MSNVLRLAIVDPNDVTRDTLKSMLLGMDVVWLEAECSRYEFFADVVAQTNPDIGVVVLDNDPEKALTLVAQLQETSPGCSTPSPASPLSGGEVNGDDGVNVTPAAGLATRVTETLVILVWPSLVSLTMKLASLPGMIT